MVQKGECNTQCSSRMRPTRHARHAGHGRPGRRQQSNTAKLQLEAGRATEKKANRSTILATIQAGDRPS